MSARVRTRRRPAVFVDRDGTLNREVDYLRRVRDLHLLPGTAAAIRRLTAAGFAVVVVTNQSGVARGLVAEETLAAIHRTLEHRLAATGARLAGIYVCPHHPEVGPPSLRKRCHCRKPAPGMVRRAARELDLDLARSYCVGDGPPDLGLAAASGTRARAGTDGARPADRQCRRGQRAACGPRRRQLSCRGGVDYRRRAAPVAAEAEEVMMPVSQELLDILACPKCKQPVTLNAGGSGLTCASCGLEYPIVDDIPVMLIDEAKPIEKR